MLSNRQTAKLPLKRLMRGWHSAALLVTLVITFACNAQVVDALRAEKPPPPPHAQSLQSMGSYDESPSVGGWGCGNCWELMKKQRKQGGCRGWTHMNTWWHHMWLGPNHTLLGLWMDWVWLWPQLSSFCFRFSPCATAIWPAGCRKVPSFSTAQLVDGRWFYIFGGMMAPDRNRCSCCWLFSWFMKLYDTIWNYCKLLLVFSFFDPPDILDGLKHGWNHQPEVALHKLCCTKLAILPAAAELQSSWPGECEDKNERSAVLSRIPNYLGRYPEKSDRLLLKVVKFAVHSYQSAGCFCISGSHYGILGVGELLLYSCQVQMGIAWLMETYLLWFITLYGEVISDSNLMITYPLALKHGNGTPPHV